MNHFLGNRLPLATRRCAQGLLVLAAGTLAHAAWSSQVAGSGIGRVANTAAPAPARAPAPTPITAAPSKRSTPAASGAARAASGAKR